MPRFYFDFHENGSLHDEEGVELPDYEAVKKEALNALPRIAADDGSRGEPRRQYSVVVSDEDGRPIYAATLTNTGVWLLR